ncbi:tetraacyldisaccharide 4'-kinase [Zavarzinia compransoris]|uniref:Tetraacyldisaccharide 4'-kinase n=1 Tax=Zavarzinia compransoris TaxID=1264899 RepID=A0A317E0Q1_9PROT|nr:tetraacyldisaccharide 4'-kinase [Zavarzinia compransoris]PWR19690.1 tetraacyldisaccharide 4'-kinase [Zavarzinia compransoris]TDP43364.1 lipid-A-disaccharide kinase [Zavarzinia compransoris]
MRAPDFWAGPGDGGWRARLLSPLSALWRHVARRRLARGGAGFDPGIPVICIGNATAGGTGKTPFAIEVARRLIAAGHRPHFLSRGHGGTARGVVRVGGQGASAVGDEPLLLAAVAPAWVARDRIAGARAIAAAGADVIVMDDGFQNPALEKRLSFLVVDGGAGLGNGRVIPAGPLREDWPDARARADAVVVIGAATAPLPPAGALPLFRAAIRPLGGARFAGRRVLAFAGIGRPGKFFDTLAACGAVLAATRAFPDHHAFTAAEIAALRREAAALDALPVTTAKDGARLGPGERVWVEVLDIALDVAEADALDQLLALVFAD